MFYSELHKSNGSDLANAKSILQLLPRSCKSMMANFCELFSNACLEPLEEEGAVFVFYTVHLARSKIVMRSNELFDHALEEPRPVY